ncbi:30S ribosomal protein S7 [Candidatus Wolfebacteria bacterium]|nr:30S ribosomal protein S7 [Candidatus Wolfebacteria bacterium]
MRKKKKYKRDHEPDINFNSVIVGRFVNFLMKDGKKSTAEKILYDCFENVKRETKQEPLEVFEKAINNASPMLEVISKRVGGANYQVPREIRPDRKFFLACNWIINAAKSKKGKEMSKKLAEELILALKNEGTAIKKKQDMHRMAEANRAFAHFAR